MTAAHRAEQPEHLVDYVAAEVAQHPALGAGLDRAGSSRSKRECTRHTSPSRPRLHDAGERADVGVPAAVVEDAEQHPGLLRRRGQLGPAVALGANGLSAMTCTPAATASSTSSRRVAAGVVTVTASTPAASSPAERVVTWQPRQSSATCARRAGSRVTTPTTSTPSAAATNGVWKCRPPAP